MSEGKKLIILFVAFFSILSSIVHMGLHYIKHTPISYFLVMGGLACGFVLIQILRREARDNIAAKEKQERKEQYRHKKKKGRKRK